MRGQRRKRARTGTSAPASSTSAPPRASSRASARCPPVVSSCCAKASTGNPVRTSAIGPWRSSAALNASACRPQVSLSLSAASCAMPSPSPRPTTIQTLGARAALDRGAPVELPGLGELLRRLRERRGKLAVLGPARDEMQDRGQRGDVRLRGRDAGFDAGAQRHGVVCGARQRRLLGVDERDHAGPGLLALRSRRQQVRARARLRDREKQDALEICLARVDRADRRRRGRGEQTGACLDEIFRVRRGVVGAAARAGDDGTRRQLRGSRSASWATSVAIRVNCARTDARRLGRFRNRRVSEITAC